MKILVTGANGSLGQGVVKELLDLGHEVIATDFSVEDIDNRAKKISTDLFQVEDPYTFFDEPETVLHMAWRDGFVHNSPSHLLDLSLHFTFLEKLFASNVKKIAVMGSMHEVGFYEGSIDENTPNFPENYYGIAKDALRNYLLLKSDQTGIAVQWLRAYYIVNNTEKGSSIFSKIVQKAHEGEVTFPFTSGKNQYDFLDYDEFIFQVAVTLIQDDYLGIINICSGEPMKLGERVEKFIKENEFNITLNYGAYPDRKYDSKAVWGNSKKIEAIIENYKKELN